MNTKTISTFAIAAIIGASSLGVAAPAFAKTTFDSDYYIAQLRYDGIKAISVQSADGSTIQAIYLDANGKQVIGYFDKDTFAPVKW